MAFQQAGFFFLGPELDQPAAGAALQDQSICYYLNRENVRAL